MQWWWKKFFHEFPLNHSAFHVLTTTKTRCVQISHVTWYAEHSRRSLYALPLIQFLLLHEDTLDVFITKAINFLPSPWRWRGKLLRSKNIQEEKKDSSWKWKLFYAFAFFSETISRTRKFSSHSSPFSTNFIIQQKTKKNIVEIKNPTSGDDDEIKKKITFSERHLTSWWMTWSARDYGNSSLWMRVILMLFGGEKMSVAVRVGTYRLAKQHTQDGTGSRTQSCANKNRSRALCNVKERKMKKRMLPSRLEKVSPKINGWKAKFL